MGAQHPGGGGIPLIDLVQVGAVDGDKRPAAGVFRGDGDEAALGYGGGDDVPGHGQLLHGAVEPGHGHLGAAEIIEHREVVAACGGGIFHLHELAGDRGAGAVQKLQPGGIGHGQALARGGEGLPGAGVEDVLVLGRGGGVHG